MSTPAGWYDDGSGTQRWWDGNAWTQHVQDAAAAASRYPTATATATDAGTATGGPGGAPGEKSKLWILFVVLGVVVIGLIALAAFFIPRVVDMIGSSIANPGGQSQTGDGGATADSAAEQAAIDAVLLFDEAWGSADCDKYIASTTDAFREGGDCATFESDSTALMDSTDDYVVTITAIEEVGDAIVVETTEDFLRLTDEEGVPLETPEPASDYLSYTVVDTGDGWAIDALE